MNPIIRNVLLGISAVVVAVLIFRRTDEQKRADAELGFTGIPGPIDELGAFVNRVSGGLLAQFGGFLGQSAATVRETILDVNEGLVRPGDRPGNTTQEDIQEQLGLIAGG